MQILSWEMRTTVWERAIWSWVATTLQAKTEAMSPLENAQYSTDSYNLSTLPSVLMQGMAVHAELKLTRKYSHCFVPARKVRRHDVYFGISYFAWKLAFVG